MESDRKKKLLMYGGAFNPPHLGHEKLLLCAMKTVSPDIVFVVPSQISPHKQTTGVPFFERAHMCRTFLKLGDNVRVSEIENSKNRKKSYTLKTIKRLKGRYPSHDIMLLMSTDMLTTFHEWHRYRRLLSLCTLVVASRYDNDKCEIEAAKKRLEKEGAKIEILRCEPFPISSTEIRGILASGGCAEDFLSPETARYIDKRGLYRKG